MATTTHKNVLLLGANSDVARQMILLYAKEGHEVWAASRSIQALEAFVEQHRLKEQVKVLYFNAVDYGSHSEFYQSLSEKPHVVVYSAGYLVQNAQAMKDWEATLRMAQVHYLGAMSIINLIVADKGNPHLERIVGLSSLSGVRGRKSNFVYGSTKAAFSTYLEGLRQELAPRKVLVQVVVSGYIRTKINAGLKLNPYLIMEPDFVARKIVGAGTGFKIIPGWKWKIIYSILRRLPGRLLSKLP